MKKIVILSALFLFFTSLSAQELPDTVFVNAYIVNLRAGPGLDYDKVGAVRLNNWLEVIGDSSGWYEVLVGDTLAGWVLSRFTGLNTVSGFVRERILFRSGSMRARLAAIGRMSGESAGPPFEFLRSVIISHENHQFDIEQDKIVMKAIFNGWAANGITEAVNILLYVLENDISGEIGKSTRDMKEIRLTAKEAVKILVRESQ